MSLQHWDGKCDSSRAGGGTAEIEAGRHWDGIGEASAGVMFLPLWCFWVNRASALPDPAGFPRKMEPKTAHVGFLPVFLVQHSGNMEVTLQVVQLPAPGRGSVLACVCCGSCLVPALVWEINDS